MPIEMIEPDFPEENTAGHQHREKLLADLLQLMNQYGAGCLALDECSKAVIEIAVKLNAVEILFPTFPGDNVHSEITTLHQRIDDLTLTVRSVLIRDTI